MKSSQETMNTCTKMVWDGSIMQWRKCHKKVWKDYFCKQHHPDIEKEKLNKRMIQFKEKQKLTPEYRLQEAEKQITSLKREKEQLKQYIKQLEEQLNPLIAIKPQEEEKCNAIICHGPGHQSRTKCRIKGKHTIHEAYYGSFNEFAQWTGDKVFSGYFDEPPSFDE